MNSTETKIRVIVILTNGVIREFEDSYLWTHRVDDPAEGLIAFTCVSRNKVGLVAKFRDTLVASAEQVSA